MSTRTPRRTAHHTRHFLGVETMNSPITPARRVRHEVRDGLAVMGFSLASSLSLALLLTALVHGS